RSYGSRAPGASASMNAGQQARIGADQRRTFVLDERARQIAAFLNPLIRVTHRERSLLRRDTHIRSRYSVDVGVERGQRVDQGTLVVPGRAPLVLAVYAPPLDLELGGTMRIERLAVPAGHQLVEALHRATRTRWIVVRERRPQLVGAKHEPGPPEGLRPRQAE